MFNSIIHVARPDLLVTTEDFAPKKYISKSVLTKKNNSIWHYLQTSIFRHRTTFNQNKKNEKPVQRIR